MSGRARFLFFAALIVGVPLSMFLLWTEAGLRPALESDLARQLAPGLRLLAREVGDAEPTDSLAVALGREAGLRVTFIGPDGRVLGDSDVAEARLEALDDHGDRPEVVAARRDGLGFDRRGSRSIALPLFYVAIPHGSLVIRAAVPATRLTDILSRTRRTGILFSLVAFLLLYLARRPLGLEAVRGTEELTAAIRRLRSGDVSTPVPVRAGPLRPVAFELEAATRAVAAREARGDEAVARLVRMLDAIEDGVASCDADGRIVRANEAFARWSGSPDLTGRAVGTLFRHPGPRDVLRSALAGEPARTEAVLGTRTTEVRAAPAGDGALLVLRDLTATRRLEGMRRDFVANVSHELKTPLTAIRGFAEPLSEPDVEPAQSRRFIERILANVERMQRLVDDLLDLTRIESGGWTPEIEDVDVGRVTQELWARMESLAAARGVELRFRAADDRPVRADPEAVEHILANLLDNAIRYSPDGGTVTVDVAAPPDRDDRLVVSVSDDGPGIPSEHVDRVFERFYRVDAGRSRAAGGTGLGLAIVKHLAVAHGGAVGIESELGLGTTVRVELPA